MEVHGGEWRRPEHPLSITLIAYLSSKKIMPRPWFRRARGADPGLRVNREVGRDAKDRGPYGVKRGARLWAWTEVIYLRWNHGPTLRGESFRGVADSEGPATCQEGLTVRCSVPDTV